MWDTLGALLVVARQIGKEYRDKVARRLLRKTDLPWMRHREIDLIREILTNLRPARCLEWGAGFSTLRLPAYLPPDATWIAVEHDAAWAARVRELNQRLWVGVYTVPPNRFPWTDPEGDGSYDDLRDYIDFPADLGRFDFVLVDGRARKAALAKACDLLSDRGVVALHDANRPRYLTDLPPFEHTLLLQDYRSDEGGIWLGSYQPLEHVLNVPRQKQVWQIWSRIGHFLRC